MVTSAFLLVWDAYFVWVLIKCNVVVVIRMGAYIHGVLINPRRACAARVTVLGLCVCVSVTQHLTFHVIVRATTILTFSMADEGRKF